MSSFEIAPSTWRLPFNFPTCPGIALTQPAGNFPLPLKTDVYHAWCVWKFSVGSKNDHIAFACESLQVVASLYLCFGTTAAAPKEKNPYQKGKEQFVCVRVAG